MLTTVPPVGILKNLFAADNSRTNVPVLDTVINTMRATGGMMTKEDMEARLKDSTRALQGVLSVSGIPGVGAVGTVARGQMGLDWYFTSPTEEFADAIKREDKQDQQLLLQKFRDEGLNTTLIIRAAKSKVNSDIERENKDLIDKTVAKVLSLPKEDRLPYLQKLKEAGVLTPLVMKKVISEIKAKKRKELRGE
jgi:hypothetical protein